MEIKSITGIPDSIFRLPSALYSPHNIAYQMAYMENWFFEDLSFGVFDGSNCLACVLVAKGLGPKDTSMLNWYGLPAISVEVDNLPKEARTILKKQIANIFTNNKECPFVFKEFSTGNKLSCAATTLLEVGATCDLGFSSSLSLEEKGDFIWENIRKSYKPLINKSSKLLQHIILNAENIHNEDFDAFRELHIQVAGRITRSKKSWDMQLQQVKDGHAFCVMSYEHGELIGASLYLMAQNVCYYGVGAYIREKFIELPLAHGAIWTAIQYAKESGCYSFEMGETAFPFQNSFVSTKEYAIGFFKRGFTNTHIPHYILKSPC